MALIARNVWKINMVGTIQANRTGAPMGPSVKGDHAIKKKTYEYKMWQHNTESLVAAVWSDNNLVKTLSNYHEPQIVASGMMRRKIGDDGIRQKDATPVDAPIQNVDYSDTYYQIDKSNQIEARYVLGKQGSKKHGWAPKLSFRFFNMTLNNAYKIYTVLHEREHQQEENETDRLKPMTMDDAIEELTHSLLQGGEGVRKRAAYHPPPQRDLRSVFDQNGGTKQRTDLERRLDLAVETGTIQLAATAVESVESITVQRARFNRRKRKYSWLEHHSVCNIYRGRCNWENCPGRTRTTKEANRSYDTRYKCIECSMKFGKDQYFCNDFSNGVTRNCHDLYHKRYHGKSIDT